MNAKRTHPVTTNRRNGDTRQRIGFLAMAACLLLYCGEKPKPPEPKPTATPSVVVAKKTPTPAPTAGPYARKAFVIGFSQCTTTEPWRVLFNKLLKEEAEKLYEVKLEILDAQDKTEKQVADMEIFINRKVDAILISPKEAPGLTDIVDRATKAGIPVIVLDRDVLTKNYACFIGGDNMEIGREAGRFAVEALGGAGKAKGFVYEIWGGMASTPAKERHDGFHEIVDKEAGIEVEGNQDGDWKQEKSYDIMETALQRYKKIDLVYAHNDPMAFGAYLAAKDAGREKQIKFVGIDAIPEEGCMWVKRDQLAATFVYPPPGVEGLRVALRILKGEKVAKRKMLPTRRITKNTVDMYVAELKAGTAFQENRPIPGIGIGPDRTTAPLEDLMPKFTTTPLEMISPSSTTEPLRTVIPGSDPAEIER